MPNAVNRKVGVENLSKNEISIIIEPIGDERILASGKKIFIDLSLCDERDFKDHFAIHYHDDCLILFEDDGIDIKFRE